MILSLSKDARFAGSTVERRDRQRDASPEYDSE